ncbi:phosphatase PAP2 family protein [Pseudonocardia endophytica]|uniref:Undecaprenyl-diphosphatase n=1 Tax=Pseudonocardia endophytica TaxID=401976 RepID=A0A4R1HZU8_PSEEN|nr:phosphatase PAP2 family protein [Pseudonocardia endophytica]TCK26450.1 undecaprenyl-diphosphatase [Pseudonocardia endophytica]
MLVSRDPVTVLGPLRRPAPAVIAVALAVAVALGVWYSGDPVAGRVDRRTESIVDSVTGDHWRFFSRIVELGSPQFVVLWAVLLAGAALLLHRPRHAVLAIVGPGVTGVATTVLKPLVGRSIGDSAGYAYPSGHTGGATSIALAVALLVIGLAPTGRAVAVTVVASAALLAGGVVGTGMITIGAHYPTDTVGGFCFAVAIGLGSAMVIDRVADRRAARAGRSPTPSPR